MNIKKKLKRNWRRKLRTRSKIFGTISKPRLSVFRSNKNMFAQVIDDVNGKTIVSASTMSAEFKDFEGDKKAFAAKIGEIIAMKCKEKGISEIVFDRNGKLFHGRVKSLADSARKNGLKF